jgi:rhamnopyranosyl-N-acetylglucosaminyl-diphospho-decaprenol beta-1,3/1,4-galactofuranosyltransferase
MKTTIAAVIVTYNRLDLLKKCIDALRVQTRKLDAILIVNNGSTDGTDLWLAEQKDLIIFHQENLGGAGGFYRGLKEANEIGYDWMWIMDDDAFCDINAALELDNAISRHMCDQNYSFWSNPDKDINFDGIEKNVDQVMFVGFAVSHKIVSKIGLPREDFFIYHDDSEYALRIVDNDFKILKLKNSIIDHGDALKVSDYHQINFFGTLLTLTPMSDFKLYFYIRNHLLMHKTLSARWIWALMLSLKDYIIVLLRTQQKMVGTKALWHGLIRKTGKYKG